MSMKCFTQATQHNAQNKVRHVVRHLVRPWMLMTSIGLLAATGSVDGMQRVAIASAPPATFACVTSTAVNWQYPSLWRSLPFQADQLAGDYLVALSPDGKTVVGGDRTTLTLWDVETDGPPTVLDSFATSQLDARLSALQVSPDGRWIAAGLFDADTGYLEAKIWNRETKTLVRNFDRQFPRQGAASLGQSQPSWASLVFSPGGERLATIAAGHGSVDLWDSASGRRLQTLRGGQGWAAAFSPDGQQFARADGDRILIWNLATPARPRALAVGHTVIDFVFGPNNQDLYVAHRDDTDLSLVVRRWNVATQAASENLFAFHWSTRLTFSPNGTTLIAGSPHAPMITAALQTGSRLAVLDEYFTWSPATAFSQDGCTFAVTTSSQEIQLWRSGSPVSSSKPVSPASRLP